MLPGECASANSNHFPDGTFAVWNFHSSQEGQATGRNPKTGVDVPIEPRRVVVFKASAIMKQHTNGHRRIQRDSHSANAKLGLTG